MAKNVKVNVVAVEKKPPRFRDRIKELRRVRASDLVPSEKNWKNHPDEQREALGGVLKEVGYASALIARELPDGRLKLIDGHMRALKTPNDEVPVLVLDVTEDEADLVLATMDPLKAMAATDNEAMASLLKSVVIVDAGLAGLLEKLGKEIEDVKYVVVAPPAAPIDASQEGICLVSCPSCAKEFAVDAAEMIAEEEMMGIGDGDYHSALSDPVDAVSADSFEFEGSIAVVNDIMNGLPVLSFAGCDVLYAEFPWAHGHSVFNERAGKEVVETYQELCACIDRSVAGSGLPAFLVGGSGSKKMWVGASGFMTVKLMPLNSDALVVIYGNDVPPGTIRTTDDLLAWMADRYSRVGDFMAGYGKAGKAFAEHGKSFALADLNPQCIGVIASKAPAWFKSE